MQRLCRDLQIVPAFALTQNSKRTVSQVESGKRFILSMGHRINEIYVNEEEELLEVTQYARERRAPLARADAHSFIGRPPSPFACAGTSPSTPITTGRAATRR